MTDRKRSITSNCFFAVMYSCLSYFFRAVPPPTASVLKTCSAAWRAFSWASCNGTCIKIRGVIRIWRDKQYQNTNRTILPNGGSFKIDHLFREGWSVEGSGVGFNSQIMGAMAFFLLHILSKPQQYDHEVLDWESKWSNQVILLTCLLLIGYEEAHYDDHAMAWSLPLIMSTCHPTINCSRHSMPTS